MKKLKGKYAPIYPPQMNLLVRQLDIILSNVGYLRSNLDRLDVKDEELISQRLAAADCELVKIIDTLEPIGEKQ